MRLCERLWAFYPHLNLNIFMNKNPNDAHRRTGEGVRRAAEERKATATEIATKSLVNDRALAQRGKEKPITDEMREEALILLANGMPMDRVTDYFGVDRCSLLVNGLKNPDFDQRLKMAMALGTVDIVNATSRIAAGEAGYSSGSIERDKLMVDNAWRYAKTIGNRIFGDKLMVDQRSITITVARDDTEW